MTFEAYLTQKKIDPEAFKAAEPVLWSELAGIFPQMHPKSFTAKKLYLINPIRRRYPLAQATPEATATSATPKAARPVMKSDPKQNKK